MEVFEIPQLPNLISRKVWVAEKSLDFHTVMMISYLFQFNVLLMMVMIFSWWSSNAMLLKRRPLCSCSKHKIEMVLFTNHKSNDFKLFLELTQNWDCWLLSFSSRWEIFVYRKYLLAKYFVLTPNDCLLPVYNIELITLV